MNFKSILKRLSCVPTQKQANSSNTFYVNCVHVLFIFEVKCAVLPCSSCLPSRFVKNNTIDI